MLRYVESLWANACIASIIITKQYFHWVLTEAAFRFGLSGSYLYVEQSKRKSGRKKWPQSERKAEIKREATAVRAESDRSQSGKRPQSEREATAVRAESDRSQSGKRPQPERKAGSDRIQSGNKPSPYSICWPVSCAPWLRFLLWSYEATQNS